MPDYSKLKAAIQQVIKQNGNNEITGDLLQQTLLSMVNTLGAGRMYMGIARPDTVPLIQDGNVFYIASLTGVYTGFSSKEVKKGTIGIFTNIGVSWNLASIDLSNLGVQMTEDSSLQTDNKTVIGAINEVNKTAQEAQPKEPNKGLSTNDFTNDYKKKVDNALLKVNQVLTAEEQKQVLSNIGAQSKTDNTLNTEDKTVVGAINEVVSETGLDNYPDFSPLGVYYKGDIVRYGKELYIFTKDHFVSSWSEEDVALSSLKSKINKEIAIIEDNIGGNIKGYDIFELNNIFSIKGHKREIENGEITAYANASITPLIYLDYIKNSKGDIEILKGTFRGSSLGVAFFYNETKQYIGYSAITQTMSNKMPFPASEIKKDAVYVSFLQYANNADVQLLTYNKPLEKLQDLKIRLGMNNDNYPKVVTPNMTAKEFNSAVNAELKKFAQQNRTYKFSFFEYGKDDAITWELALDIASKNLRQFIGDTETPKNIICDRVNKALTERVYRFYDAKPLSDAERDASIRTGLKKGEPSAIVSKDGGILYIYANGKRINTTDGVSWSQAEDITLNDEKYVLHESINYIDGIYYLIAAEQNAGGNLRLYTSEDGLNFEFKGFLFKEGIKLDGVKNVRNWGNPYLIKNYGDGKFYLYIETQDGDESWRIHLITYNNFTHNNSDGTIGDREIYNNNPIISRPYQKLSNNTSSAGNPDFFKLPDNRPVKVNNKYYLLFHSTFKKVATLMRASSYDLKQWTIDGIMWDNRDIPTGGDETSGNADACTIEFKGRTYLFYTWDINNPAATNEIRYTIDDRPLSVLLNLLP